MNLPEVIEDLRVSLKMLKKELLKREKVSTQIKKVDEFNQLASEIKRIEMSIELLNTTIYILKIDSEKGS